MKNKITLLAALLATATTAAYATNADPDTLFLWDGTGNNVTVKDGGAGDSAPSAGAVTYINTTLGSWSLIVDTGTTKPANGSSAAMPALDLNFDHVSSSGPASLGVAFFDDNFNPANLGPALAHIGGTLPSGVTLTFSTYVNKANVTPGFSGNSLNIPITGANPWTLLNQETFHGGGTVGNSFGDDLVGGAISGGSSEYSLLIVVDATTTGAATFSGDSNLHTVPDGGMTLMLLGSGLTGLALLRRSLKLGKA